MHHRLFILAALCLVAAVSAGPALGQAAEPRIAAQAQGNGFNRTLIVRLTDVESGAPISGASVEVRAQMIRPHFMNLIPRTIPERTPPGTYRLPYTFVMPGEWKADFDVSGPNVVGARTTLNVPVGQSAQPGLSTGETAFPARVETRLTDRDWITMVVLWVHGLAALGWIVGVIVMAIALSTPPILVGGVRARVREAYRTWGAWAHWSAVPVIVATGIYNMVYVTPFKLAVTPSAIDNLSNIAYGRTYEAILLVKLALFVVLLTTGTIVLLRTVRGAPSPAPAPALAHGSAEPTRGPIQTLVSALGPAGIAYVLTVPLILGAAMALRYVHILSHVAEVINV